MAKIGEGRPEMPKQPEHMAEMQKCVRHFREHLKEYDKAATERDKAIAKDRMSGELSLMDVVAAELKKETRVQEGKLSQDFQVFEKNPSENNRDVLEQDLTTLDESLHH